MIKVTSQLQAQPSPLAVSDIEENQSTNTQDLSITSHLFHFVI